MQATTVTSNIESIGARFQQASASTKLVVLHYLAKQVYQASKTATPGAFFSQQVQGVLKQVQQLPREERQGALEEILTDVPTRLTEAYEALDTNMKMAFWYRLFNVRRGAALLPKSHLNVTTSEQENLIAGLNSRDSNELVSFLREAVSDR